MMSTLAGRGRALVLAVAVALVLPGLEPRHAHARQAGFAEARRASLQAALQAQLDSLRAGARFPGATLAIALPDGTTLAVATGMADTVRGEPMTPAARMLAGSVGKTWVAALALQLVQESRLALDAPISDWLGREPWFDRLPNARDITVRMLLRHTSGLGRYEFDPEVTRKLTAEPDHVWTPEERLSYLLGKPAPFAAGQGWNYSDTNYVVLGMILERITGKALNDEIAARLLGPLALRNTMPSDRRELPGVVQGYAGPANPFGGRDAMIEDGRFIVNPQMEWAGGGYAATTTDLARWAAALYQGRAFDPALLSVMLDGVPAPGLGRDARYGLGVIITTTDLGPGWGHSGFFPGYLTEMRFYPELRFAVALQFNTSVGRAIGRNPAALLHGFARTVAAALRAEGTTRSR
jgi:D-alanyl-D-alanine carboxypeptidase